MKNQIVALAKKLVSVPSVSGNIEESVKVLEVVKKELSEYPFTPFVSESYPSLLYSNKGKDIKKFKIILYAHLDVVPGETNQFIPHERDGKLFGRGAYDMKATAAAMILLFKEMKGKLSYPLGLQLTTDEETIGIHGAGYQIAQGIRADFVIAGECGSNFRIVNQAKGRLVIKVTTKGHAAHSAYAWLGDNAIWEMYQVLGAVMHRFPKPLKETAETTVNITNIATTNNATNKIPDNCTAYLDVRYINKDAETIVPTITSLLPENVSVEVDYLHKPHYSNPKSQYIASLKKSIKNKLHEDSPLMLAHGTSDTTFYSAVGCEAIEFGPLGQGNHHNEELVDIQSLEDYYHILKDFLLTIEENEIKLPISDELLMRKVHPLT